MRVLIADRIEFAEPNVLREAGLELREEPEHDAVTLESALEGVDVLVVRSTKVTETALRGADDLSLIVRAGAGTDNIDLETASARGVFVSNVPGRNAAAVAELTIGLLLAVDRRIVDATNDLREGRWEKKRYAAADGIREKRIGLFGIGSIGLEVAMRAHALGMSVYALDRPRSKETVEHLDDAGCCLVPDLISMARDVDVLTLHAPLTPETREIVDAEVLDALGSDGILLNTARGGLVDEAALLEAMDAGLRVGLDVFADEPRSGRAEFDSPVARHRNLVATPHIGASTDQAQRAIAAGVADTLMRYRTGEIHNCVNLRRSRERTATISVRHFDRPGVLAAVLGVLRENSLNVEFMDNRVFEGGIAAIALIDVTGASVDENICVELDVLDGVIASDIQRGSG